MLHKPLKIKFLFLFFLFLSLTFYNQAQEPKPARFEHLSIEDGLSQSSVFSIVQDKEGYMWFATADGLNRYDGYNFKVFKHNASDSNSISHNIATTIFKDSKNRLWIGTYNGLNLYNDSLEVFQSYKYSPNSAKTISNNIIRCITEDKYGNLWIGTSKGLNKFNPQSGEFTRFFADTKNKYALQNDHIRAIFIDKNNIIWLGTYQGLHKYNIQNDKFYVYQHQTHNTLSLSNNDVGAVFKDSRNRLWVGTDEGLNIFDTQLEEFKQIFHNPANAFSIGNNLIRAIFEDKNGNIWIGTNKGLSRYLENQENFLNFYYDSEKKHSLSSDKIWSIYEDNAGIIWIGTLNGGINKLDKNKPNFLLYRQKAFENNTLSNNSVWAIFQDINEVVWIGTDKGLNAFDRKTYKIEHYYHNDNNKNSITNDLVKSICGDKQYIWIGTDAGLNRLDLKTKSFKHYTHDPNNSNSLSDNIIKVLIKDSEGNIWIGTSSSGVNKFEPETERFTRFIADSKTINSLSNNKIWSLYEDSQGNIWIGTFGGGLNKFDKKTKKFTRYLHIENNAKSLSNNIVRAIIEDSKGNIWVGTSDGLNKLNPDDTFETFRTQEGLPNEMIYAIVEDKQYNLWLSTNRGLSRFNPVSKTFKNYDILDGLQSLEFNQGAGFISEKGELFFGGINGLNAFYPEDIIDNKNIPPLVITDFKIFNKSIPINSKSQLNKSLSLTEEITLTYKEDVFSFEFAALNFTNPEKNKYKYIMEGFDQDWNYVGNRRYANYTNLDPGKYTFIVCGSNNDGIWNESGKSIKIIIKPPFYKTRWFYFIVVLFTILLVYAFIKYREKRLIKEKRILERKVAERTFEIQTQKEKIETQHDEIKAKNLHITDSIRYAKKIQQAILPSVENINQFLPQSFVFFRPKDIVSGDFYWFDRKNDKIFFAAVDCTGHGVPGAFMSLIGYNLLNEALNKQELDKPSAILDFLHMGIIGSFSQREDERKVKDGMDIALCSYDQKNRTLEYAGAYNPLLIVHNNEITEYKADIKPIGESSIYKTDNYTNNTIPIAKDDIIYIFTDGFIDQFGGPDYEKYMKKSFREKLLQIHQLPMEQQLHELSDTFDKWKGNFEQIDDVLVMGIKFD